VAETQQAAENEGNPQGAALQLRNILAGLPSFEQYNGTVDQWTQEQREKRFPVWDLWPEGWRQQPPSPIEQSWSVYGSVGGQVGGLCALATWGPSWNSIVTSYAAGPQSDLRDAVERVLNSRAKINPPPKILEALENAWRACVHAGPNHGPEVIVRNEWEERRAVVAKIRPQIDALLPTAVREVRQVGGDKEPLLALQIDEFLSDDTIDKAIAQLRVAVPHGHQPATGFGGTQGTEPAVSARFVRIGDYWEVAFGGATTTIKHSKGMDYLHKLLMSPGKAIHVWTLCHESEPPPETVDTMIDEGDVERLRAALSDKRSELAETTNGERREVLEEEIKKLTSYLTSQTTGVGKARRPRRTRTASEKVRENVGKAVSAALSRIRKSVATLSEHLEKWIDNRTGMAPCYRCPPSDLPAWVLRADDATGAAREA